MSKLADLYEADLYRWAMANARLIREGRIADADWDHVAEELEGMGKSERRALASRLEVLLAHLLKWSVQPGERSSSWRYTIKEQRRKVERLLRDSPSLRGELPAFVAEAYPDAILLAARETGLEEDALPQQCPFTEAQILDPEFWPDR